MNVDTDTQYAFTRPIVDHVMTNYEAVLKVDGETVPANRERFISVLILEGGGNVKRSRELDIILTNVFDAIEPRTQCMA